MLIFQSDFFAEDLGSGEIDGMDRQKLLWKLISGSKNIRFAEAIAVAEGFGFKRDRVSGSHHILVHPEIPELINLQNVKGKAKPYQVKQLLKIVEKYNLHLEDQK
jgi:predicted RNA binding protein YcfA (HicA-like mRNA interferase family)